MKEEVIERYKEFIGDNVLFQILLGNKKAAKRGPKKIKLDKKEPRKNRKEEDEFGMDDSEAFFFTHSPAYITGTLRHYQIEGLNWLINMYEKNINCILADEMGLGKTLQTISLLGYLYSSKKNKLPNLLIVPKSTLQNWKNEFKKFMPNVKTIIFHCSRKDIRARAKELQELDYIACITTYEMCLAGKAQLQTVDWQYIVIDEAHRIKNEQTILSKVVRLIPCSHRLLLTGTPLQNNIHELWALLNFLAPEVFSDGEAFDAWAESASNDSENETVDKLRNLLSLFILRREKADVEKSLLPKKIINLYSPLTDMQRKWYKMILEKDAENLVNDGSKVQLMNIVCQLRKCCNHPYLFDGAEPGPPYTTGEHIVENSGKLMILDKLLVHLKQKGSRVLIFSQMTRMLDILEDYCNLRQHEYCRIDGSTSTEDRCEAIEEFNKPNSEIFIFLLSTRAGGLGINLATADVVIVYDNDWNPQMDLQAQDRAHRIGQKKQVYVFNFLTENTIEEKILERAMKKLKLDEIIVQNGKKKDNAISQNELLGILASGVDNVFDGENKLDRSIEEIIRIGMEKTDIMNAKIGEQTVLKDLTNNEIKVYEWEGEDYSVKSAKMKLAKYIVAPEGSRTRGITQGILTKRKSIGIRQFNLPEYQFHPQRLHHLQKKEMEEFQRTGSAENLLTREEEGEKKILFEQGFNNWTKRDFWGYIRACEKYGRDDLEKIMSELPEKDAEEVKKYGEVFWSRIDELSDSDKIQIQIQKGEHKLVRTRKIKEYLKEKIKKEGANFKVPYPISNKSMGFTEDADRFILLTLNKKIDSPGCYDELWHKIREVSEFAFDYYLKIRTPHDLQKRAQFLFTGLLKDKKGSAPPAPENQL
ncbi:SWI/SNF-related matrix-associated actin-dependent regulator of chromatin subfamily A member 5 [Nematocida minor]|uniref:SWI/SNF-related matrix-associated actin-dependent regulator of chromatin subfamily A member 5 n=1 Tax=Nematocida minor TaxID=1912983 RepID=UPI00221EA7FC|nr:SWI/SNF-related matrix-associated actin-dependent regulator of chromatin subfamily A member 5 [Nematocida minor]KAI5192545.1 SWI/SNF-related matrix-associated actin-dependent regulator of chromatin subfamily A member 5 [Nematocida minor]